MNANETPASDGVSRGSVTRRSVIARHPALDEFVDLFLQMLLNFVSEVLAELTPGKDLSDPVHGFTGARTSLIPSSIRSKLKTSRSKCLLPVGVSS